jgi:hypothetical protein
MYKILLFHRQAKPQPKVWPAKKFGKTTSGKPSPKFNENDIVIDYQRKPSPKFNIASKTSTKNLANQIFGKTTSGQQNKL